MNMKGSLPLLILYTLSLEAKHGYAITKQIKEQSEGVLDFTEGTLYPTLHDLEKRGFVESYKDKVNGRTRRCYQLTPSGLAELEVQRQEWQQFSTAVSSVLGGTL